MLSTGVRGKKKSGLEWLFPATRTPMWRQPGEEKERDMKKSTEISRKKELRGF